MTLPNPRSLADELALSLQHIRRISNGLPDVHDGNWRGVYQGLVAWVVHEQDIPAVKKGLVISEVCANSLFCTQVLITPRQFQALPILIVVPTALPKDALVEMQAFLHTCQGRLASNTEDGDVQPDSQSTIGLLWATYRTATPFRSAVFKGSRMPLRLLPYQGTR
jgi:hypothetical protein